MAPKKTKKESPFKNNLQWIKNNKIKSLFILISIAIVLSLLPILIQEELGLSNKSYDMAREDSSYSGGADYAPQTTSYNSTQPQKDTSNPDQPSDSETEIPGIKIIDANAYIETDNIKNEEEKITSTVEVHDGYIEQNRLTENLRQIRINMTVRVPSDNFDSFFEEIRKQSEVESFAVSDYRIDVKKRETELSTVQETIDYYDEMIEETREMYMNNERINLIKELTDSKMQLRRQENSLINSLEESRRLSEYSTVRLTVTQSVSPKVWPEDIKDRFLEKIQRSFDDIIDTLISLLGNILLLFITVISWILYVLTVIVPLWITYRVLRKLYIHIYTEK